VIESISLVSGPLPVIIVVLGVVSVLLAFDWRNGTWKRQLRFGVPIAGALVGLTAILVDGLALIPYQFPNSYYLWVGLVLLAVVVAIVGWPRFSNWRRGGAVLAVVLTTLMAISLVNQEYQYYPTAGSLVGADAQHVTYPQLLAARSKYEGTSVVPHRGYTVQIPIPGKTSGFAARAAYVWIPPIWVTDPTRALTSHRDDRGRTRQPSDWNRGRLR